MSVERRIVTILFADLVDFTPLSERLDAEDVATVQDAYFAVVRETVGRYGGSLEKFIGDAVMAAFGLGQGRDDDAERAVRAGLALIHGVDSLGARLGLDVDALRIRVGVNTGEAVIGKAVPAEGQGTDIGRVTGDTVNVAARLQAASLPGRILVGAETVLAVEGSIELEPAQSIALKGKAEPVRAHLVTGIRPEPSRELAMGGMVAPTVGRGTEVDRLVAASTRVRHGSTARILVVAPPGVGKTRLLAEFTTRLAASVEDGSSVVWRTRSREGTGVPFSLVREVLMSAQDGVEPGDLERSVEALGVSPARARVVVATTMRLLVPRGPDEAAERDAPDRSELFGAWSTMLRALARGRTVCWLVEDLHWASADEIGFLESFTADPACHRLLVVATARPSVTRRLEGDWEQLDLAPLPGGDARDLIAALVGDALPPDLVDRILERSDGNPLFIEELLRTWVSVGTLHRPAQDGPWRLTAPATEIPLPTTIQAIYASQLDDLSGEARSTARRAAVAGRRFPIDVLSEFGADDPGAAVAELARRAVVTGPQVDLILGDTYGYRHALVRDAGYASLARAERADLHVRLARWLEGAAGDDADRIAGAIGGHYADALANASSLSATVGVGLGRTEVAGLAAAWLERGGDRAIATGAYDAARVLLGRAVDLTPADDPLALGRRLTRLGDSSSGSGSLDLAIEAYQGAVTRLEEALSSGRLGGPVRDVGRLGLATAARALGRAHFEQTRFAEALAVADRATAVVGDHEAARLPLELLAIEARNALSNDPRSLFAEADRLRDRAAALGDPDVELEVMNTDVRLRSEIGEASPEDFRTLGERFAARGRWRPATTALLNGARMSADADTFEDLAGRADAFADAHGQTESQAWLALLRAGRWFVSGDWDEAAALARIAVDLGEAGGYHRAVVRTWFVLGPIASARRDRATLERAATWFEAREREHTFPDSPYGRLMHAAIDTDLASVGLRDGSPPDLARLEPAFGLPYDSPDWFAAIERVVRAMLDADLAADARTAADLVPGPSPDRDPLCGVSEALIRAWVADATGDRATAVATARAGLALGAASSAPWWSYRLLRVITRDGTATPGDVERATAIAERLGLEPDPTD